jgi:hypothetical protein
MTGGIGAIDFKALVGGKLGRQPQVVQQCGEVDRFTVVLKAPSLAEEFGKPPCPMHVVQKGLGMDAFDQCGGFAGKPRIWSAEAANGDRCVNVDSRK